MNSWQKQLAIGSSLICAMALLSSRASALSCASSAVLAPADGTTDVPTNARIWGYASTLSGAVRLVGPDGDVPLSESFVLLGSLQYVSVLTPDRELEPNTQYRIQMDYSSPSPGSGRPQDRFTFFTGAGPAQQAPAPPELLSNEAGVGTGFVGVARWRELEFSQRPLLIGDVDAALGELTSVSDVTVTRESFDISPPDPASRAATWISSEPRIYAGIADCMLWPDEAAERVSARFGAFDLAGNFSDWVEVPIELPPLVEAEAAIEAQEALAQAEHNARLQAAYEGADHGQGHVTGCTIARGSDSHARASLAIAALALGMSRYRRRRAVAQFERTRKPGQ